MIQDWKSESVVQYFSDFTVSFRVVTWIMNLSFDIYIVVFYILIFLIFVMLIDFVYISIAFKHKRFSFFQPI